jgi:phosphoglycolate phosphatase-like HAD superfamily hydrolase
MLLFLFDIDGTLLLSGGAGGRALDQAFTDLLGIVGALDGISLGGATDPSLVDQVYQRHLGRDATVEEYDRVMARYLVLLEEGIAQSSGYRLMPHVLATLDALQARGHLFGLATGNVEAGARIKLRRGGLDTRFAFGGYGCDSRHRAELVARARDRGCALAGRSFAPEETYVIGDTPLDVAAARAVGLRAVAVATGGVSRAALEATGADLVLDDLGPLLPSLGLE